MMKNTALLTADHDHNAEAMLLPSSPGKSEATTLILLTIHA